MLEQNEVPSKDTLGKVVVYLAALVALGISFSFTLGIMNTEFEIGAIGTLVNVYLSFRLARYVALKHFTETSES